MFKKLISNQREKFSNFKSEFDNIRNENKITTENIFKKNKEMMLDIDYKYNMNKDQIQADSNLRKDQIQADSNQRKNQIQADSNLRKDQIQADSNQRKDQIQADSNLRKDQIQADSNQRKDQIQADSNQRKDQIQADSNQRKNQIQADSNQRKNQIQADSNQRKNQIQADSNQRELIMKMEQVIRHQVINVFKHANKRTKEELSAYKEYNGIVSEEAMKSFKVQLKSFKIVEAESDVLGNIRISDSERELYDKLKEIYNRYEAEFRMMDETFLKSVKIEDPEIYDEIVKISNRKKMYRAYEKLKISKIRNMEKERKQKNNK